MRPGPILLGVALAAGCPALLRAQGRTDYFNVESPQVKPLAVARVAGHDYLLVCNTPDNSVEVYDTDESEPARKRFRARVPVGLEPVSIAYDPATGRAYTANFLGDSISVFRLDESSGRLRAFPLTTRAVPDEPIGLALSPDGQSLFVTHNTLGNVGWRRAATLDPVQELELIEGTAPRRAIKEPRTILARDGKLYVLGFKGGNNPLLYDFDVYVRDLATEAVTRIEGLGTTNFNMALAGNGDLWVVGGDARNSNPTLPDVANEPTGFVVSTVAVVPAAGGPPVVRDLNDQDGTGLPVASQDALAQPTDVALYEPEGEPLQVFVAAFGSDRLGVLTPDLAVSPYAWPVARIDVPTAPGSMNGMAGPRGLAVRYAVPGDPSDPGDRLYVMNRVDNSVSIVDPVQRRLVETFALRHDPTPFHIRRGRRFLYSAKLSGSGFVSCASCHMDGRTDSLVWNLGTPLDPAPPFPAGFEDGIQAPSSGFMQADKGPMMTQTLQGLLNFEVEPAVQGLFTNGPYHWRADKADFTQFNGAFVALMGAPALPGGNGLTDADMLRFQEFVHSIQYPPNHAQPETRRMSGSFGTPDVESDGSGAARGLKLFHTHPLPVVSAGRSCVQCHSLPDGSNNRGTAISVDVMETAATRGMFQREMRLDRAAGDVGDVITGVAGLNHVGGSPSINGFVNGFSDEFPADQLLDVKRYQREFDFGVAPLVGRAVPVDAATRLLPETAKALDLLESQARLANVGVAVQARLAGKDRGYWLDLTLVPAAYAEVRGPRTLSRSELLALAIRPRDRLVFTATPLGSERRVASVDGRTEPIPGPPPSSLSLRPAVPNSAHVEVPSLRKNWDPLHPTPAFRFTWTGTTAPPTSLKTLRLMQRGLGGLFGLPAPGPRHEPPRRFVVAGNDIRQGAVLVILVPDSTVAPDPQGPPDQIETVEIALPIHPTGSTLPDGRRIWQTAAEAEPLLFYTMMLGGRRAPGVAAVLDPLAVGSLPEPPGLGTFSPSGFNWHYVKVVNQDGTEGVGGWQRLTLE